MHDCDVRNMFHSDMDARIDSLHRNIEFLQKQHGDTLGKLHDEIEGLKRENKGSRRTIQIHQTDNHKLQEDRANYLEHTLDDKLLPQGTDLSNHNKCRETRSNSSTAPTADKIKGSSEGKAGFITSLQPLMIQRSQSDPPRSPTLMECEVIIRQLYNANSMQSQEILRVKGILKDIVSNKKITAENYLLTKAIFADGKRTEDSDAFPQLSLQTLARGLINRSPSQASKEEKVILPALTRSLHNNIAERHRRTQAVQRRRFQRPMHLTTTLGFPKHY
ncbi:coiled-coil domain-containing protein 74B isoform X2 [Triplophysa dalaica]|uniref:coiled-coil domain-containing protein 74B isoform X2 n=1 Tax=Triplophysa dalaica TaxID=1582913 RepID=UPI0024E0027E|nr:coiled-coil domain-containing protein 74B isoform X2 [Triplophysa dalaica]